MGLTKHLQSTTKHDKAREFIEEEGGANKTRRAVNNKQ